MKKSVTRYGGICAQRFESVQTRRGFTLVEMLVSVAILGLIMLLAAQMMSDTERIWKVTSAKIDAFRGARTGFEQMTDQLRQATVKTYYDYFNATGETLEQWSVANASNSDVSYQAASYGRQSELHFISGPVGTSSSPGQGPAIQTAATPVGGQVVTQAVFFQTPLNFTSTTGSYGALQTLLNASGFFVEFGPDVNGASPWLVNGPPLSIFTTYHPVYRFRLMQFIQPTENLTVYNYSNQSNIAADDWFSTPILNNHATCVRVVADNVIGLFIWPKETDSPTDTLTTDYVYDSRLGVPSGTSAWPHPAPGTQPLQMNQMPPILRVAIVTLDEVSASALQAVQSSPSIMPNQITSAFAASNPSTGAAMFTNPINMDSDLAYLQTELGLVRPHVNYRVFDTTIAIRSAKFSSLGQ